MNISRECTMPASGRIGVLCLHMRGHTPDLTWSED